MTLPLVSIGIPNYNYARYLGHAIESACRQTYRNIEILVADNASTDDSWNVISSFGDQRIRAWRHKRNQGAYPNWDSLFKQARGEYFKILQADDLLDPEFVAVSVNAMQAFNADVALSAFRLFGDNSGIHYLPWSEGESEPRLLSRSEVAASITKLSHFVQPTALLLKRTLVPEGFGGTDRHMSRDFVLWAKAITRGRVVGINRTLSSQRIHASQDRHRRDSSMAIGDILDGLEVLKDLGPQANEQLAAMTALFVSSFSRSFFANLLKGRASIAFNILRQLSRHGQSLSILGQLRTKR